MILSIDRTGGRLVGKKIAKKAVSEIEERKQEEKKKSIRILKQREGEGGKELNVNKGDEDESESLPKYMLYRKKTVAKKNSGI